MQQTGPSAAAGLRATRLVDTRQGRQLAAAIQAAPEVLLARPVVGLVATPGLIQTPADAPLVLARRRRKVRRPSAIHELGLVLIRLWRLAFRLTAGRLVLL